MYLLALIGVLGVSASGPIVAAFPSVPPLSMALWRNALGTAVMASPVLIRDPRSFGRLRRREWGWSAAAALALALHFACFMTSIRMTSVAAATALVCLQAAWIALFQTLLGVRYGWRVGAGSMLALTGVVVITGFDLGGSPDALVGDLLAILGGILAAVYTLCGAKARESMGTGLYTSLCYGMTAGFLLVLCLALGQPLWGFGVQGWIGIIALAVCAQLLGHSIFNYLLSSMGPLTVSTLVLFEIPGAAILAAVFLQQELPAGTMVGLGIILAGLYFVVRGQVPAKPAR